jgi:tetratricopeptide (TPR) repeat protein
MVVASVAAGAWLTTRPGATGASTALPTSSPAAYDLFVRGRVNIHSQNARNNDTAIRLLRQAVAADPNFALAYAELGRAYALQLFYFAPAAEKRQLAEDAQVAVDKALDLNPNLGEAHLARGLLLWTHANRFPHDRAVLAYKRALELNPGLHEAHHQLALVYLHIGLFDKAWAELKQVDALNPGNMSARFRYGVIEAYRGRYDAALEIFDSTSPEQIPVVTFQRASALFQLGRIHEARAIVDEALAAHAADEGGTVTSVKAMLWAREGKRAEAEDAIARTIEVGRTFSHFHHSAYNIASAWALLGNAEEALKWLESAAADGFPCYPLFEHDANLNSLRKHPRFVEFMARLKRRWQQYDATL